MTHKKNTLIGAHMSISNGFDDSIRQGESIGCTAIQIFTGSNRQWKSRKISDEEIDQYKKTLKSSSIEMVVAHSRYLINIGSNDKIIREKSINALIEELEKCESLKIPYLIIHPGSGVNITEEQCLELIAKGLDEVFSRAKSDTHILLENAAGQGKNVGYKFEHIAYIRSEVKNPRKIGVCFDTCHAFVSGYDFTDKEKYEQMWKVFDHIIGLNHLKVIHINDSKTAFNSRIDRHEDIGKGKIGLEAFQLLMNDPKFIDIPKILETPKGEDHLKDDKRNLEILKSLIE
ncbi:deoxyribonuclease IV [Candidatus Dependentiae bacterium]|nr:deoxyribonuclease IV [Candidatus Dependentiae bacterium]